MKRRIFSELHQSSCWWLPTGYLRTFYFDRLAAKSISTQGEYRSVVAGQKMKGSVRTKTCCFLHVGGQYATRIGSYQPTEPLFARNLRIDDTQWSRSGRARPSPILCIPYSRIQL